MDAVSVFLITISGIFLVGILGEIVFQKTNVPDVVWLMTVGVLIGPVFGLVEQPTLRDVAPFFGAVTLVVVLFEGGTRLRLGEMSASAPRAMVLAALGFSITVVAVAAGTMAAAEMQLLPSEWTWMHGITTGTILGGSSSVVIMPALSKAGLAPRLGNLVSLESAISDVLCVVGTVACIEIVVSGSTDPAGIALALGSSFGIGLAVGVATGLVGLLLLRGLSGTDYAYPFTLAVLLALYVGVDALGGSAALAVLAVAILLGNATSLQSALGFSRPSGLSTGLRDVHHQIAFITKSFFFTFIGAMLGPPWGMLILGAVLGLVLLPVRIPVVVIATVGMKLSRPGKAMVAVTLPRGMAAGVLAMLPMYAGMSGTEELPTLVFPAVFVSILIFAVGFPLVGRKLVPEDLVAAAEPPPVSGPVPSSETVEPDGASRGGAELATPGAASATPVDHEDPRSSNEPG